MATPIQQLDLPDLRELLRLFALPVLLAAHGDNGSVEGVFSNGDALLDEIVRLDSSERYKGVYVGLNPCDVTNPLALRGLNQTHPAARGESVKSEDIVCRRQVLIDIDRKTKTAQASHEEIEHCKKVAENVQDCLTHYGIGAARQQRMAFSGNGFHILLPVDLPNDEASGALVRRLLEALALKFNDTLVEIDTANHDARRVTRAYGTLNRKFEPTPSELRNADPMFDSNAKVTADQLEAVIAAIAVRSNAKSDARKVREDRGSATVEDVQNWAKQFGQTLLGQEAHENGVCWAIKNPACVSHHGSKHPGNIASKLFLHDGVIGFDCWHSWCKEHLHFKEYRQLVEIGHAPYYFPWENVVEIAEAEPGEEIAEYPIEVWDGTLYAQFADLCPDVPREFTLECIKTVVGAVACGAVLSDQHGINLRSYTVLVEEPQSGKGTAIGLAKEPFKRCATEGFRYLQSPPRQPTKKGEEPVRLAQQVVALLANFSSSNGLFKAAFACPRVLAVPTEFDELIGNTHNETSGSSLLAYLREAFDTENITATLSAERNPAELPSSIALSILTSTQPETLRRLISRQGGLGSGFASRLTLVVPKEIKPASSLANVSFGTWPREMFKRLAALETEPLQIVLCEDAKNLLQDWYIKMLASAKQDDLPREVIARLNTIVLRNALHLAWLHDTQITLGVMEKAIKLGDYQLSVRKALIPGAADNALACHQMKIVGLLQRKGVLTARDIYNGVRATSVGTDLHTKALDGLVRLGQLAKISTSRKNSFKYGINKQWKEEGL